MINKCELCQRVGETKTCIKNGSIIEICKLCIIHEDVIELKPDHLIEKINELKKQGEKEMIVYNYAELIKKARKRLKITQEQLAKKIHEKISLIEEIEENKIIPNFLIAKKLSSLLNIKLIDSYRCLYPIEPKLDFKKTRLKIGDLREAKDLK